MCLPSQTAASSHFKSSDQIVVATNVLRLHNPKDWGFNDGNRSDSGCACNDIGLAVAHKFAKHGFDIQLAGRRIDRIPA